MKPKHLVVDTAGFVKCTGLWEYGESLYSVPDVVREIRDKQARERYESLPVAIKLREPQPWAIKFINEFSKKTGDYASLSLADVKILALTYELEIEALGSSDHLRSEPEKPITVGPLPKQNSEVKPDIEGFHLPAEELDRSVTNSSDILLTEPITGEEESYSSDSSSECCLDEIPAVDQLQNVPPTLSSHKTVNNPSQDYSYITNIYWRHMLGLEDFLAGHSYIGSYSPTSDDDDLWKALVKEYPQFCPSPTEKYDSFFSALNLPPTTTLRPLHSTFPCIRRWSYHIASFSVEERSKFPPSNRKLVDILHEFGGKSPCWGESCPDPDQISNNKGLFDFTLQNDMSRLSVDEQSKANGIEREKTNEDGDPNAACVNGSNLQEGSVEEELEESFYEDDDMGYKMQQKNIATDKNIEADGKENTPEEDEENYCSEEDDDDDEGWITPSNIKRHKLKNNNNIPVDNEDEGKDVVVACLTSDFAMQNVLKHIGLSVMGVDGKLIWQIRTFILRCYACFKTTSNMTKIFCPKCGNKTLKRVSVTVNPDGTQKIWINFKKPINTKGMRFSLPQPRGGQHARNPILVADQKEVRQFSTKMSKKKVNPLNEDYDPDTAPFAMRDVYSRAAQLGYIGGKCHNHYYWETKNPNAHVKKYNKK